MLGKTHEDIKQRARLDGDTQLKGTWIRLQRLRFISSTYLKNSKVWENNSKRFTRMIQVDSKDVSKEPKFLYKSTI
jgi:hypothetical protein